MCHGMTWSLAEVYLASRLWWNLTKHMLTHHISVGSQHVIQKRGRSIKGIPQVGFSCFSLHLSVNLLQISLEWSETLQMYNIKNTPFAKSRFFRIKIFSTQRKGRGSVKFGTCPFLLKSYSGQSLIGQFEHTVWNYNLNIRKDTPTSFIGSI